MNERTHISRRARAAAGVLMVLGAVLLVTIYVLPRVYFAKVTMEVTADDSGGINVFGGSSEQIDRQFIAAQISILRSKEILYQVIQNLLLNKIWSNDEQPLSMEQVFVRLVNSLEIREVDRKGMIEIGVYDTDPQGAANIANTIAVVYQRKRFSDLQRIVDRGLEQLRDEVEKQRARADEAVVDMNKIREAEGITDSDPNEYGASLDSPKGKESLDSYVEAKIRALQSRRISEAAKTKYATELLTHDESNPAKIWEKAEPPIRPIGFGFRRLRHALTR